MRRARHEGSRLPGQLATGTFSLAGCCHTTKPKRPLPRPMHVDAPHQLISRQDGVVSASQAIAIGVSRSAISRRRAAGEWVAVARAVYLVAGHHRSARAQARIAVLSVSADAALGGVAAAWWLGLHPTEPRKHLVFTASRGVHGRSSATAVIRHRHLDDIALLDSALLSGTVKTRRPAGSTLAIPQTARITGPHPVLASAR